MKGMSQKHIAGSDNCSDFGRVFAQYAQISGFNHQYHIKQGERGGPLLSPQYPGGGGRSIGKGFSVVLSDILSSRAAWAT